MAAYYYGFSETGVVEIDNILCSVASAGKGAHHTEHWCEHGSVDLIQRAAVAASESINALRARVAELERRNAELVDMIYSQSTAAFAGDYLTPAELAAAEAWRKQDA
jgi:hypothetical protein